MFYPFSFNIKYSLWKCWLEVVLIWGKIVQFKCLIEAQPDTHRNACRNIARPCSPMKVAATLIVSNAVAGRLEFNSGLRHQTPLEERRLQTTDLPNSAQGFFSRPMAGPN